jgi:hypothetical protein
MSIKPVVMAVLLIVGGGGAAAASGVADVANTDAQPDRPTNVDATAALADGTVTVVVTNNGDAYRGVNVSVEGETADDVHSAYENETHNETDADEVVATTGENGTATVAVGNVSELEVELTAPGFAGELEYVVNNGSLVLVSEEYEYVTAGNDTEDSDGADENVAVGDNEEDSEEKEDNEEKEEESEEGEENSEEDEEGEDD